MLRCAALLTLLMFGSFAHAQAKAEDVIKYRQSVYRVLLWNWMPMNAMMRGSVPFDSVEFSKRAERVANLSTHLLEGYPPGSGSGATTGAKPEIWTQFDDFRSKMSALESEAAKLAITARGGDEAATKAQFGVVAGTCKSCHESYKAKD